MWRQVGVMWRQVGVMWRSARVCHTVHIHSVWEIPVLLFSFPLVFCVSSSVLSTVCRTLCRPEQTASCGSWVHPDLINNTARRERRGCHCRATREIPWERWRATEAEMSNQLPSGLTSFYNKIEERGDPYSDMKFQHQSSGTNTRRLCPRWL